MKQGKTNMIRLYGRALKGERVLDYAPHGHWNTTTLVAAITWEKAIAPMVLDGPMDGPSFHAYVEHVLLPELSDDARIELHYQPPYSPDFNPIELMWSKVKNSLRTAKARTQEQLYQAIAHALEQVTSNDTQGFFQHCNVAIKS